MTWSDFYLISFLVGFGLSAVALLAGSIHLHLPHLDFHHGLHVPHAHGPHMHADLPWFNFGTIAAFLAWFGGTGYLLQRYYSVWFVVTLGVSILSGIGASAIVFLFLAKVLMRREAALDPADYDMVGVLGKLNLPIREGGTGELVYSQEGTRRVVEWVQAGMIGNVREVHIYTDRPARFWAQGLPRPIAPGGNVPSGRAPGPPGAAARKAPRPPANSRPAGGTPGRRAVARRSATPRAATSGTIPPGGARPARRSDRSDTRRPKSTSHRSAFHRARRERPLAPR